jgi:beta-lactamase class A
MFRPAAALLLTLILAGCGEPPMLGQEDPLFDRQKLTADFQPIADRVAPGRLGVASRTWAPARSSRSTAKRAFPCRAWSRPRWARR